MACEMMLLLVALSYSSLNTRVSMTAKKALVHGLAPRSSYFIGVLSWRAELKDYGEGSSELSGHTRGVVSYAESKQDFPAWLTVRRFIGSWSRSMKWEIQ